MPSSNRKDRGKSVTRGASSASKSLSGSQRSKKPVSQQKKRPRATGRTKGTPSIFDGSNVESVLGTGGKYARAIRSDRTVYRNMAKTMDREIRALHTNMNPVKTPTAPEINSLPQHIRRYIHELETRTDPTGDVQHLASLKEQVGGLTEKCRQTWDMVARLQGKNDALEVENLQLKKVVDDCRRLTREIDVIMHGEDRAAKQPSLCDLIEPIRALVISYAKLRKACRPVIDEAKERADYMDDTYNLDAHVELTLTIGEIRAIHASLAPTPPATTLSGT